MVVRVLGLGCLCCALCLRCFRLQGMRADVVLILLPRVCLLIMDHIDNECGNFRGVRIRKWIFSAVG